MNHLYYDSELLDLLEETKLENFLKIHSINKQDINGNSLLVAAIYNRKYNLIKLLLKMNINIYLKNNLKVHALFAATQINNTNVIKKLLTINPNFIYNFDYYVKGSYDNECEHIDLLNNESINNINASFILFRGKSHTIKCILKLCIKYKNNAWLIDKNNIKYKKYKLYYINNCYLK
jgi:ankyrin repeat protein